MQDCLELNFYQTTIDVFIVGFVRHAISTPTIISSTKDNSEFIDILIHELLHRLISDNVQKTKTGGILLNLFPNETLLCRNHIVLNAVLKKIYINFFRSQEKITEVIKRDQNMPDYKRAWELVDQNSEDVIIKKFQNLL